MKLIVGLGNPGRDYAASRHNVGFRCVNALGRRYDIQWKHRKGRSRVGTGVIEGVDVVLAKPETFMNRSGGAVGSLMKHYNVTLADLVVVHDDLDLPLGRLRIRHGSSAGGHNGVKSIIGEVGQEFTRVRIGIGRPEPAAGGPGDMAGQVVDFVLGDFTREDMAVIGPVMERAVEAVVCLVKEGATICMNRYN